MKTKRCRSILTTIAFLGQTYCKDLTFLRELSPAFGSFSFCFRLRQHTHVTPVPCKSAIVNSKGSCDRQTRFDSAPDPATAVKPEDDPNNLDTSKISTAVYIVWLSSEDTAEALHSRFCTRETQGEETWLIARVADNKVTSASSPATVRYYVGSHAILIAFFLLSPAGAIIQKYVVAKPGIDRKSQH
jgi:hypothetical protein